MAAAGKAVEDAEAKQRAVVRPAADKAAAADAVAVPKAALTAAETSGDADGVAAAGKALEDAANTVETYLRSAPMISQHQELYRGLAQLFPR